ncbi:hypothetical protein NC652_014702 [Populus alba x Populus x berolinensis]|nr:hypothetical protein NC652_014702 [Populus alba x Populus x berolinensis]
MAFTSFLGRVLFASVFILSAYQEFNEFGVDGGLAAKALKPKFGVFTSHVQSHAGIQVPEIEIKHLVSAAIFLKGTGGILFIIGSSLGAYLLNMALYGALLFFIGMKNSFPRRQHKKKIRKFLSPVNPPIFAQNMELLIPVAADSFLQDESSYDKGVKGLVDSGVTKIPRFFIHPRKDVQKSSSDSIPSGDFRFQL